MNLLEPEWICLYRAARVDITDPCAVGVIFFEPYWCGYVCIVLGVIVTRMVIFCIPHDFLSS